MVPLDVTAPYYDINPAKPKEAPSGGQTAPDAVVTGGGKRVATPKRLPARASGSPAGKGAGETSQAAAGAVGGGLGLPTIPLSRPVNPSTSRDLGTPGLTQINFRPCPSHRPGAGRYLRTRAAPWHAAAHGREEARYRCQPRTRGWCEKRDRASDPRIMFQPTLVPRRCGTRSADNEKRALCPRGGTTRAHPLSL